MKAIAICSIAFIFTIRSFSQWVPLVTNTTANLQDICFIDENTGLAAGFGGVLIRTTNAGVNWTLISCPTTQNIMSVCFPSAATGYASGYTGYILKTSTSGSSWFNAVSCGINVRSISFINTLTGITGGGGNLMCFTTNGGSGWNPRYTPTPHAVSGVHFVNSSLLMVTTSDMPGCIIYKSTNGGNNWANVLALNNSGLNISYSLSSVYFKDNITGFVTGSYNFYGTTWGQIYCSTNSGDNWTLAVNVGPAQFNNINCVHFGDSVTGFAGGSNGIIMHSTNGGANWAAQVSGITSTLNAVHMLNALTGYICGAEGVILKTTNGGITGLEPVSTEIPQEYMLYQNYPNPFNPATKIRFSIPAPSPLERAGVRLIIYDILGRDVAVLVNEQLQPGTYEVEWDGTNFSSGVYYYTLSTGNYINTKKMILIK